MTATAAIRLRRILAVGVAGLLLGGLIAWIAWPGPAQITLTAQFTTAPGLYAGNTVDILGMPVGHVTGIHPGPSYVTVTMTVPRSTRIPATAKAIIMAPNVVNDRYVALTPAWQGGPTLPDRAVIPVARTAVPVSVDEIIGSLDELAKALGPSGANANGALSDLLKNAARAFGGNGKEVHDTLTSLGGALGALSSQGPDLTSLIDNLGTLTHSASTYTDQYKAFANNLATVSTYLASDDADLGSALQNLQQALGALATFVQQNSGALGASVGSLNTFAAAVAQKQQALADTFRYLPVALRNLGDAYDPSAPGGPALKARLDPVKSSAALSSSVCGSPLLRLLLLVPAVAPVTDPKPGVDLACGVNGVLAGLPTPPNAGAGPDLSVAAIVGSR